MLRIKQAHPGTILRLRYILPLGLSIDEFSNKLDLSKEIIEGIINKEISINEDIAIKLSTKLNTTSQYWIDVQNRYDLSIK